MIVNIIYKYGLLINALSVAHKRLGLYAACGMQVKYDRYKELNIHINI